MSRILISKRRQFLRGLGGFTLALPVLPSLLRGGEAEAQGMVRKRYVHFASDHGGVWPENMFPGDVDLPNRHSLFTDHDAMHGPLVVRTDGAGAYLSEVARAPESELTSTLVGKINMLRGLGTPYRIGHNSGGHLGNYARHNGNDGALPMTATMDQIMAWSPNFYRAGSPTIERTIVVDLKNSSGDGLSWTYSDPVAKTGSVQQLPAETSSLALFDRLFIPDDAPTAMPRRPVVDRVLEHYNELMAGRFEDASRLSSVDRQRLTEHMDRLSELQRRLEAPMAASCGDVSRPTDDATYSSSDGRVRRGTVDLAGRIAWFQLYNDVIATAFMCGTSQLATVFARRGWVEGTADADWHDVAHDTASAGGQATMVESQRNVFRHLFLDLASKLDVEEFDGQTYLDNSLIAWTQEAGEVTHFTFDLPVVTAGSAGGFFQTGLYADYRKRSSTAFPWQEKDDRRKNFKEGLTYNQWMRTVLESMGVDRSEYADPRMTGYGLADTDYPEAWTSHLLAAAEDRLPIVT